MAAVTRDQLRALLSSHGRLFSEELGIRLEDLHRGQLFNWFLASLLFGARIAGSVAVRTYRAFEAHRLLTPEAIAAADFGELLQIMAEGGYVRYDGITSRKVQGAARKLLEEYGGDLNRLHELAAGPEDLTARLTAFKGVGPATAGIFLRELRGLWPRADPPLGNLARLAAEHLGIRDAAAFWRDNALPAWDFRHLEAALTRLGPGLLPQGTLPRVPNPPPTLGRSAPPFSPSGTARRPVTLLDCAWRRSARPPREVSANEALAQGMPPLRRRPARRVQLLRALHLLPAVWQHPHSHPGDSPAHHGHPQGTPPGRAGDTPF